MNRILAVAAPVVLFGIIFIALSALWVPAQSGPLRTFLEVIRDVGIALVIVGILSLPIEYYFRRRTERDAAILREEISKDVFHAALGYVFPEKIYDQVKAHVLEQPFLRKDYKITVSVEPCEHANCMKTTLTLEFELHRLSDQLPLFKLQAILEREDLPGIADTARFLGLKVESETRDNIESYTQAQLEQFLDDSEPPLISLRKDVDMGRHECLRILIRGEQYQPMRNFSMWLMTCMTENLTVFYSVPDNLEVQGFPNHPSKRLFNRVDEGRSHKYELIGGLLPFQGITVSWKPRAGQVQGVDEEQQEEV